MSTAEDRRKLTEKILYDTIYSIKKLSIRSSLLDADSGDRVPSKGEEVLRRLKQAISGSWVAFKRHAIETFIGKTRIDSLSD